MQDTVQLQTASTKSTAKTSAKPASAAKKNQQDASLTDPFLQIIMSMIGQTGLTAPTAESGDTSSLTDAFGTLGNTGVNGLLTGGGTNSTNVLMSLLGSSASGFSALQTLGQNSGDVSQDTLTQLLGLLTQSPDAANGSNTVQTLLQQLAGVSQSDTAATQLTALLSGQNSTTANLDPAILSQLNAQTTVNAASTDENAGDESLLSQQQSYSRTIARAKELLTKTASSDTEEGQSADKLHSSLGASKTVTPFELQLQNAAKTESAPLTQQLTEGLKSNLSLGKSEFTMSLKPESLGEITVKLTEEAGRSVLTITTASAATAKLLNSDLDALKAAMAPLNVRVNEAVTQTAAPQQSGSQLFDMAGQQFAGQQQQQQFAQQFAARQNGSYNSAGRQTGDETLYTAQAAADSTARTYVGNGLNAYV